jgi:ATP-dependent exoDNAse (exonuclease V) alpha subunit
MKDMKEKLENKTLHNPKILSADQKNALGEVETGKNLVISGQAGSGKTFLVPKILELFEDGTVAVTATLGLVAQAIGGRTISSFLKLGLYDFPDQEVQYRNHDRGFANDISHIKAIIIDEYYILNRKQLHQVDVALRATHEEDLPFGGVQVILMGDHMQVDPYEGEPLDEVYLCGLGFSFVNLETVFRQDEKGIFFRLLQKYRFNQIDNGIIAQTKSMMQVANGLPELGIILTPDYAEATRINEIKIAKAKIGAEKSMEYFPESSGSYNTSTKPPYESMEYFTGMQVLHVVNKEDLVNGDSGIITDIQDEFGEYAVKVVFENKGERWIYPYRTENKKYHFITNSDGEPAERYEEILGYSQYVPLVPCYALTVRKAQGMTLQRGCLSRKIFSPYTKPKVRYTGLSRFMTLNEVYLV